MIAEKIKVRISNFALLIINDDSQNWGFIKHDESSNINAFLNKLIPNMLEFRKERREKIKEILQYDYQREDAERIYECVNSVIDEVYFNDAELSKLSTEVWIRPSVRNAVIFDEIESEELPLTSMDMSAYIRGLINEYVRFPKYKRLQILFTSEMNLFERAIHYGNIVRFNYLGEQYKVYVYWISYQYALEHCCCIIAYDLERKEIRSFRVEKIKKLFLLNKVYRASEYLNDIVRKYLSDPKYDVDAVIKVAEKSDEE